MKQSEKTKKLIEDDVKRKLKEAKTQFYIALGKNRMMFLENEMLYLQAMVGKQKELDEELEERLKKVSE